MSERSAVLWRRGLGLLFLLGALAMLICGETVLDRHLQGLRFLWYWLACIVLTGLAMLIALFDLRSTRRRSRSEQKELWKNVFYDLEAQRHEGPPQPPRDAPDL